MKKFYYFRVEEHFNISSNYRIDSLFSYCHHYSRSIEDIDFIEISSLDQIEYSENNYLLFSVNIPKHLKDFYEIYKNINGNINLVIGGNFISAINLEDLFNFFDKKIYILSGPGEEFFLSLIEGNLGPGIYHGEDFNRIKSYTMNEGYIKNYETIYLTFRGSRCSWSRCKFCHHIAKEKREILSVEEVFQQFVYYYNNNVRSFIIFDNELDVFTASKFLEKIIEERYNDVKIYIFGMRLEDIDAVKKLLKLSKALNLLIIGFGLEFIDNELMRIYDKGIEIDLLEIISLMRMANNTNTLIELFLIWGLPFMNNEYYNKLNHFYEMTKKIENANLFTSFFRLSKGIRIFDELEYFKIKLKNSLKLDYFNLNGELSSIRTIYYDFYMPSDGELLDRTQIYERHLKKLSPELRALVSYQTIL